MPAHGRARTSKHTYGYIRYVSQRADQPDRQRRTEGTLWSNGAIMSPTLRFCPGSSTHAEMSAVACTHAYAPTRIFICDLEAVADRMETNGLALSLIPTARLPSMRRLT